MDKKIIFVIVFISLFALTGVGNSQVIIDNPLVGVNDLCDLLTKIAGAVAGLVGVISVIMIIVAGMMYLLSAGSPDKITKAKTALIYAIVGLAIAIAAGSIVATIKGVIQTRDGGCSDVRGRPTL